MHKLNVLVAGSTGYIGTQLIKLLCNHNNILIKYLCGNSSVGKMISEYDESLKFKKLPKIVKFKEIYLKDVDLIFTALPNGEAQDISKKLLEKNTLIDLAADFRLENAKEYQNYYKRKHKAISNIKKSIYSLPEISEGSVKNYKIISCPACYPTSILLPLTPLIKKDMINLSNIIIDSKSGYSGAGRLVHKKNKDKNLYESLSSYGVGFHRHNSEINQEIKKLTKKKFNFTFTPHLTPMFRGILSTIYVDVKNDYSIKSISNEMKRFYTKKKFIKIKGINTMLSTNDVINTNNCYISVCNTKYKNKLVIISVIDNLIKGGAGQAIQNMNIKFGFKIDKGLL